MPEAKQTILIVDDTETNIDILLDILNAYDIVVAIDGESALEIASEDNPDLILLDIMMPNMDGYVTKPFKPRELTARIKTQIKLKNLLSDLNFIASYDYLTKVYNRRKFFELANKMFAQENEKLFAIMIDIDKFKKINYAYGHPIGDEVLKAVAATIQACVSKDDLFARIGGEEFAIICRCNSDEEIMQKNEFIRQSIEELEVNIENGIIVKVTISNGIAEANDTDTLDSLLKRADDALYEEKGEGRNKVIFRN
jgi:two-component system glycerol uptake and utilization response regulator